MSAADDDDVHHPLFPVHPDRVLKVVAEAYGVAVEELTSFNRAAPLGEACGVAYRLLHDESRLGWIRVAKVMGRATNGGGSFRSMAQAANPAAVDLLRVRLRLNGNQGTLW